MLDKPLEMTTHARERLAERVGVRPHKVDRLVAKAWRSVEPLNAKSNGLDFRSESRRIMGFGNDRRVVRMLMGKSYVFADRPEKAVLLTVV